MPLLYSKCSGGFLPYNEMRPKSVTWLSDPGLSDPFHLILNLSSNCLLCVRHNGFLFLPPTHEACSPCPEYSISRSFSPFRSQLKCHFLSERLSLTNQSTSTTQVASITACHLVIYLCRSLCLFTISTHKNISSRSIFCLSYSLQKPWHIICM